MLAAILLQLIVASTGVADTMPTTTLDQIHLRDPFILPVPAEGKYYIFGTGWTLPGGPGFMTYTSTDLVNWEGPFPAFTRPDSLHSKNYWAPEVHEHKGKYYMFATFYDPPANPCRYTAILVSDKPGGPYEFHSDGPATPRDWYCLDGTLYIDEEGKPWMVFCHEWVQIHDGAICAMPLMADLKEAAGDPALLFKASSAPWGHGSGEGGRDHVTDGPYLHRNANGHLLMLWSSFGAGGYKTAIAHSTSGKLYGPWEQEAKPIYETDGGHGMLFRRFDGQLMMTLHAPNTGDDERPRLFEVKEVGDSLEITPWKP